jgi:hypothetical protein
MLKSSILFFMLSPLLFSQTTNIQLACIKTPGDSITYQFEIKIDQIQLSENGMIIGFPEGVTFQLSGVTVGANELWLKNSGETPSADNLAHWQSIENRLEIRLNRAQIKTADQVTIRSSSQIPARRQSSLQIFVYQLTTTVDGQIPGNALITTANMQIVD